MYALARALPLEPARRPSIESSAKMYSRVIRSPAVIAAVVGRGARVRGSSPVAVSSDVPEVLCAHPAATSAARRLVANRLRSVIKVDLWGRRESQCHGPVVAGAPKRAVHCAG